MRLINSHNLRTETGDPATPILIGMSSTPARGVYETAPDARRLVITEEAFVPKPGTPASLRGFNILLFRQVFTPDVDRPGEGVVEWRLRKHAWRRTERAARKSFAHMKDILSRERPASEFHVPAWVLLMTPVLVGSSEPTSAIPAPMARSKSDLVPVPTGYAEWHRDLEDLS